MYVGWCEKFFLEYLLYFSSLSSKALDLLSFLPSPSLNSHRGSPDRDGGVSNRKYFIYQPINYSLYTCDTGGNKVW